MGHARGPRLPHQHRYTSKRARGLLHTGIQVCKNSWMEDEPFTGGALAHSPGLPSTARFSYERPASGCSRGSQAKTVAISFMKQNMRKTQVLDQYSRAGFDLLSQRCTSTSRARWTSTEFWVHFCFRLVQHAPRSATAVAWIAWLAGLHCI